MCVRTCVWWGILTVWLLRSCPCCHRILSDGQRSLMTTTEDLSCLVNQLLAEGSCFTSLCHRNAATKKTSGETDIGKCAEWVHWLQEPWRLLPLVVLWIAQHLQDIVTPFDPWAFPSLLYNRYMRKGLGIFWENCEKPAATRDPSDFSCQCSTTWAMATGWQPAFTILNITPYVPSVSR